MTSLYNGEVELEFTPKGHKYHVAGKPVASVTTVLGALAKPALIGWAAKETANYWADLIEPGIDFMMDEVELEAHVKASKQARFKKSGTALKVGTMVHDFAEMTAKVGPDPKLPANPQAKRGCEAFLEWWGEHNIQVEAVERKLYSKEFNFCGTADLIAKIEGHLCVLDYKTSTGVYDEMKAQLAAYRHAYQEEMGVEVTGCWVVRFDKETGEPESYSMSAAEMDAAWLMFKGALDAYNGLAQLKAIAKERKRGDY